MSNNYTPWMKEVLQFIQIIKISWKRFTRLDNTKKKNRQTNIQTGRGRVFIQSKNNGYMYWDIPMFQKPVLVYLITCSYLFRLLTTILIKVECKSLQTSIVQLEVEMFQVKFIFIQNGRDRDDYKFCYNQTTLYGLLVCISKSTKFNNFKKRIKNNEIITLSYFLQ